MVTYGSCLSRNGEQEDWVSLCIKVQGRHLVSCLPENAEIVRTFHGAWLWISKCRTFVYSRSNIGSSLTSPITYKILDKRKLPAFRVYERDMIGQNYISFGTFTRYAGPKVEGL